jgi:hypothetical protein
MHPETHPETLQHQVLSALIGIRSKLELKLARRAPRENVSFITEASKVAYSFNY